MVDVFKVARCEEHGLHGERANCFVCGAEVEQVPMVRLDELVGEMRRACRASRGWEAAVRYVERLAASHGRQRRG